MISLPGRQMMTKAVTVNNSEIVVNVTEADFEFQVIAYSQNVPVVVEFWAPWCKPCKELGPILERIALQSGGVFRLARLDVDENPNLAIFYNVRSIPVVKVFSSGGVVAEFSGLMPEFRVREFIARITPPSPSQLALERANGLLSIHKFDAAEKQYRQLLDLGQEITPSLLGLAKTLLWKGELTEAREILTRFPASREFQSAQVLLPLVQALADLEEDALPSATELDAAFSQGLRLVKRGKLAPALDGLLDILRSERKYADGRVHKVVLAILEWMGEDDPQTRAYRQELASILF